MNYVYTVSEMKYFKDFVSEYLTCDFFKRSYLKLQHTYIFNLIRLKWRSEIKIIGNNSIMLTHANRRWLSTHFLKQTFVLSIYFIITPEIVVIIVIVHCS